jgi:hypothetical protein
VKMPCDDLDIFVDGELPAGDAQTFRDHLAFCARCQYALRGRMLEAVVMGHGDEGCACPSGPRRFLIPFQARHKTQWVMITAGVALAAMLVLVLRPAPTESPVVAQVDKVELAAERRVEVRFSEPMFDRHRPLLVMRAAGQSRSEPIALAALTRFEKRDQWNAIVAARALGGDVQAAIESAKKLPATARSLSDRAALELLTVTGHDSIPRARQEQAADLAISLTSQALRLDPSSMQAKWNKAIALKLLGLPLEASRMFKEIAERGEPGWSDEAAGNARDIDRRRDIDVKDWKQLADETTAMIGGGAPLTPERARHAPSEARKALYQAIATASTVNRLDALLPLATTLDDVFSTTTMVALIKRIRASNLARRAPIAEQLRGLIVDRRPVAELAALRARALQQGLSDVALASFLAMPDGERDEANLAALAKLTAAQQDSWWKILEILRRTYFLQYIKRDPSGADAAARSAIPLCRQLPGLLQCGLIMMIAGAANADLGRLDTALANLAGARKIAQQPATRDEEALVLNVMAQVMAYRMQEAIDSVAVSDAYFGEGALRNDSCAPRLQGLDFLATAALERHRYNQAAEFRARADELESGRCSKSELRLNGETVRLRLLLAGIGTVAALRHKLDIIGQDKSRDQVASYVDFLDAAAMSLTDRPAGDAALQRVIASADADPSKPLAPKARSNAYNVLLENAAAGREADKVTALIARRLGVQVPDRCVVAVAQWHRVAVAVRGADAQFAMETRDVPEGALMVPPSELVSPALRDHLKGCPRVEVMVSGPYFGTANLLEPTTAWFYKAAESAPVAPSRAGGELVVTDVRPPDDLNLPQLRTFEASSSAVTLRGADATPSATLEHMKTAGLIIIVAHGVTDAREPAAASLILSPNRDGEYMLSASKVRTARLDNAPVVILAGCDAGRVQVAIEPWSLATSFLAAGARAVIAPTEQIPDEAASEAFSSLVSRIRAGMDPVDALQAERKARGSGAAWLSSIVVFE